MKAVLWTPGEPLGKLTAERVKEIQGTYTGPLVAVVDEDGGVMIIQPMDPNTGENWKSEADAMAFAERYMTPASTENPEESSENSQEQQDIIE
jgi:hypothetical protein